MRPAPAPHRLPRLAAAVLLAAAASLLATPALADTTTVRVGPQESPVDEDGPRYSPADVTVTAGATVRFVWESDGHSVRHQPGQGETRTFDSHPACRSDGILGTIPQDCGGAGEEFEVTLDTPGTYRFQCGFHGEQMRGVLRVAAPEPAPEPSPQPTAPPEPSPTPATTEHRGSTAPDGPSGGSADSDRRPARAPRSSSPLTFGQAAPAGDPFTTPSPGVPGPDTAEAGPHGADHEPELEPFPAAPDPAPEPSDPADEVALPVGRGGSDRTLPLALAVAAVVTSTGLVVRFGIFGPGS